jgi:REP element-mobilizing transposase RayT
MDSNRPTGYYQLRKGRVSQPGRIYFLTTVTKNRVPLFRDLYLGRAVIRTLDFLHTEGRANSLAFVLMPDHLHWLIELRQGATLSSLMQRAKAQSAREINRLRTSPGEAVWESGYHDRALRREEDLRKAARYLVANPLRAGLVDQLGNYSLWDAAWLEEGSPDPVPFPQ